MNHNMNMRPPILNSTPHTMMSEGEESPRKRQKTSDFSAATTSPDRTQQQQLTEHDERVKDVFLDIINPSRENAPFEKQFFVILQGNYKKNKSWFNAPGTRKRDPDHHCLLNADKIVIMKRSIHGQIYVALKLEKYPHFSIGPKHYEELRQLFPEKIVYISSDESTYDFSNQDGDGPSSVVVRNKVLDVDGNLVGVPTKEDELIDKASDLIVKLIPHVFKTMKIPPKKGNKRGTISANIGLSATNSANYKDNRTTIFGNIKPSLIKNDFGIDGNELVGKLALMACKEILPTLGFKDAFQLDLSIPGHQERKDLRELFAKQLHIHPSDYDNFLMEAVSIVLLPFMLNIHFDTNNDSSDGFDATVCIHTHVSFSCLTGNEKLKSYLLQQGIGENEKVHVCVIFYNRRVCCSAANTHKFLAEIGRESKMASSIVDMTVDITNKRNYDGNVFDRKRMEDFNARIQTQVLDAGKLEKAIYKAPHHCVPSAYDPMSKWSGFLDFVLHFHCQVRDLSVEDVIEFSLSAALTSKNPMVFGEIMRQIFEDIEHARNRVMENGVFRMLRSIAATLGVKRWFPRFERDDLCWILTECNAVFITSKPHALKNICRTFASNMMKKFDEIMDIDIAYDFVQFASLLGLLPLQFMTWAACLPKNEQDSEEKNYKILEMYQEKISKDVTAPIIQRMSKFICGKNKIVSSSKTSAVDIDIETGDNGGDNMDVYFYHPHVQHSQNFYRLKEAYQLQILTKVEKKASSEFVTNWKRGGIMEKSNSLQWDLQLNWNKLEMHTCLKMSRDFRARYFLEESK